MCNVMNLWISGDHVQLHKNEQRNRNCAMSPCCDFMLVYVTTWTCWLWNYLTAPFCLPETRDSLKCDEAGPGRVVWGVLLAPGLTSRPQRTGSFPCVNSILALYYWFVFAYPERLHKRKTDYTNITSERQWQLSYSNGTFIWYGWNRECVRNL
jgi:hypothetical protein